MSRNHPHVYAANIHRPSLLASVLLRAISFLPAFLRSRLEYLFPEWFLPSSAILKCIRSREGEDPGESFLAEQRAYERLRPLQGIVVPRLYGTVRYNGQDALLLQYIPGPTLADSEGAIMTVDEAFSLLQRSYSSMTDLGATQEDAQLRNFILNTQQGRIMVVDLEFVAIDESVEYMEYSTLSTIYHILELYLCRQRSLLEDNYLEAT